MLQIFEKYMYFYMYNVVFPVRFVAQELTLVHGAGEFARRGIPSGQILERSFA